MRKSKKLKLEKEKNEQHTFIINRLLETIFCNKELEENEIDFLLEQYPTEMQKVTFKQNLINKDISAKIGFKI